MQPIVNLEELPGKVVGRRGALRGDHDRLVRNAAALMPRLPYPKGAFRFRTHEEADAWTNEHILRAALQKAREMKQRHREKDMPDRMFLRQLLAAQGIQAEMAPPPRPPTGLRAWLRRTFDG